MEIAGKEIKTLTIDHHKLVAATCKDLSIAERIKKQIGKSDQRRVVSTSKAVVTMILNSLGFTHRRLYLTHQFLKQSQSLFY